MAMCGLFNRGITVSIPTIVLILSAIAPATIMRIDDPEPVITCSLDYLLDPMWEPKRPEIQPTFGGPVSPYIQEPIGIPTPPLDVGIHTPVIEIPVEYRRDCPNSYYWLDDNGKPYKRRHCPDIPEPATVVILGIGVLFVSIKRKGKCYG